MGAFISEHVDSKTYIEKHGQVQNSGRVNPWVAMGFQFGQYTIGGILSGDIKLGGDGKGGKDGKVDEDTQKQIDAKTVELNKVFDDVKAITGTEVKSSSAIGTAVTSLNSEIQGLETKVSGDKSSASIQETIKTYFNEDGTSKFTDNDELNGVAPLPPSVTYDSLQQQLANAIEIETQIQNKKAELARLQGLQGQAENIELEILRLQDSFAEPEVKYDVAQESKDLNRFNTVLKSFPTGNKATQEDVDKLIKAFNGDAGNEESVVSQKHAKMAIDLLKKSYPNLNWSALQSA